MPALEPGLPFSGTSVFHILSWKYALTPHHGETMNNIILIGMPGAGKSTTGVILAKALGMRFVDTDIVLQEKTGQLLQEIIDAEGHDAFLEREERTIESLRCRHAVIATGGSVVLGGRAMESLKSGGVVVYLKLSFEEMTRRLNNIPTRGIILLPGQSLRAMYDQRVPLYEKYADITVDCPGADFETIVQDILQAVSWAGSRA